MALLAGAEYIGTLLGAMKNGVDLGWGNCPDVDPGSDPEEIGDQRPGVNDYERSYGLHFPVNTYPLFENAIRGTKRRTPGRTSEMAGRILFAVHESRVGKSLFVVSDLPLAGRNLHADARRTASSVFPTPNISTP